MFILNKLLALQSGEFHDPDELAQMAIAFFAPLIPTDEPFHKGKMFIQFDQQPLHCLHLFRESLVRKGLIAPKIEKKLSKRKLSEPTYYTSNLLCITT